MKKIIIQDPLFEMFPEFRREVIVVRSLNNRPSYKRIRKLLKKEIDRQTHIDLDNEPRVLAWDQAHKKFGAKPRRYMPSIRSLLKRIKSNPALPFINSAVALFNYISLKYCLPCGGDDVGAIEGDLVLGIADGSEKFQALGSDQIENPQAGEVIYFDSTSKNVMCRRWNWRNGDHTKIEVHSQFLVINIDCLPPITPATGMQARDELAALLAEHCQAETETASLHSSCREHNIL
jgi:lysyl-tRNA synthetase class 2